MNYKPAFNEFKPSHVKKLGYNSSHMEKQRLIKLAGGTQESLAAILGISQAAVSQWTEVPEMRIWQLKVLRPQWFM